MFGARVPVVFQTSCSTTPVALLPQRQTCLLQTWNLATLNKSGIRRASDPILFIPAPAPHGVPHASGNVSSQCSLKSVTAAPSPPLLVIFSHSFHLLFSRTYYIYIGLWKVCLFLGLTEDGICGVLNSSYLLLFYSFPEKAKMQTSAAVLIPKVLMK